MSCQQSYTISTVQFQTLTGAEKYNDESSNVSKTNTIQKDDTTRIRVIFLLKLPNLSITSFIFN
jgi:hypothetical protein